MIVSFRHLYIIFSVMMAYRLDVFSVIINIMRSRELMLLMMIHRLKIVRDFIVHILLLAIG